MYRTFIQFRDGSKKYFYQGDDVIQAVRIQKEIEKRYENNNSVFAFGREIRGYLTSTEVRAGGSLI